MKRICMIVMSLYPNDERVRREANALTQAMIAVDVICLRGPGEAATESLGLVTVYRIMPLETKENIKQYTWTSLKFMLRAMLKLQLLSIRNRYEAIQAHNMPDMLIFAGLQHKLLGRPLILDLHDLTVELFESKFNHRSHRLLPLVAAVEKMSCGCADQLITTSLGFKERLVQRGVNLDKITLVLNTPDPRVFQYGIRRSFAPITENARLLYHGTVAERFGLTVAIRAMRMIRERIPGSTLAIYGKYDPSYRTALEAEIARLGLGDCVYLNGWLTQHKVCAAIEQADIGVVPYLANTFMNLALSTKSFEYAALGLPIVASRLPSLESIFSDRDVTYFEPQDEQTLADSVVHLCRNPDLRQERARQALAVLDQISGQVMEDRYLTMIERLINTDMAPAAQAGSRS